MLVYQRVTQPTARWLGEKCLETSQIFSHFPFSHHISCTMSLRFGVGIICTDISLVKSSKHIFSRHFFFGGGFKLTPPRLTKNLEILEDKGMKVYFYSKKPAKHLPSLKLTAKAPENRPFVKNFAPDFFLRAGTPPGKLIARTDTKVGSCFSKIIAVERLGPQQATHATIGMVAFMISKHSNSPFEPQQASPGCSTNTPSAQPHPGWATWGGAFQSQVEKPLGLQTWHWLGAILASFMVMALVPFTQLVHSMRSAGRLRRVLTKAAACLLGSVKQSGRTPPAGALGCSLRLFGGAYTPVQVPTRLAVSSVVFREGTHIYIYM